MRVTIFSCVFALLSVVSLKAQSGIPTTLSRTLTPPSFNAKLTIGFNYDLLRPPTDVSFDYAKGYAAINFPFESGSLIPKKIGDDLWGTVSDQLSQSPSDGAQFQPQASASQFANSTIRVDIPMLGGVATFSNIQNVYINYTNTLGNTNLGIGYDTTIENNGSKQSVSLLLKAIVNVPVEATMGWETMTFGYAYKVNKDFVIAADVNRHIFLLNLHANVDVDMLGNVKVASKEINLEQKIDYSSNSSKFVGGEMNGHYEAEAWSGTIGIKYWRLTWTSRFGFETKAKGYIKAKYGLPSIVDARTFQISSDITSPDKIMPLIDDFQTQKTDSVSYYSNEDASWKLPQGHTIALDIVRDHVSLSYTKILGMIEANHVHNPGDSANPTRQYTDLDVKLRVDNIIMLNCSFYNAFLNLGVFSLDATVDGTDRLLSTAIKKQDKIKWMILDNAAMLPIVNLGAMLGSKMQIGFELDILPLPAFKTGVTYHF